MDKTLRNCLLISIAIHGIFIFTLKPYKISFFPSKPKELELTYYKKADYPVKSNRLLPEAIINIKEKIADSTLAALAGKRAGSLEKRIEISDKANKPIPLSENKLQLAKTISAQDKTQDKMLIYHEFKDFSNNPSYLNYYNTVRARIEKMANANKPYIFKVGEVNLIFTILDSGDLKSADLIDRSSVSDPALRQCALDSVYAASPFPPFTGDIKENNLTMQVTISFEK